MDDIETIAYTRGWRDYKKRRTIFLFSFVTWIPLCFVISYVANLLGIGDYIWLCVPLMLV
jgi:hypothetical protein